MANNEKLQIFIGGVDILSGVEEDSEDLEKEVDQENKKRPSEFRLKIIEALNKRNEIKELRDLYDEAPPDNLSEMNPIMFIFHLPSSLQNLQLKMPNNSKTENFFCLFSGKLLLIAAVCQKKETPWGSFDVSEKVIDIIKTAVQDVEILQPCLTFGGMLYTKKADELDDIAKFRCLVKESDETVYDNLENFYLDNYLEFESFYSTTRIVEKINETIFNIKEIESCLLCGLKTFVSSSWKHPFERAK